MKSKIEKLEDIGFDGTNNTALYHYITKIAYVVNDLVEAYNSQDQEEERKLQVEMQDSKREELWGRLAPVVLEREEGFGNITVGGATDQQGKDNLLDFIATEISKAREEGFKEGERSKYYEISGYFSQTEGEHILERGKEYVIISREEYDKLSKLKDNK